MDSQRYAVLFVCCFVLFYFVFKSWLWVWILKRSGCYLDFFVSPELSIIFFLQQEYSLHEVGRGRDWCWEYRCRAGPSRHIQVQTHLFLLLVLFSMFSFLSLISAHVAFLSSHSSLCSLPSVIWQNLNYRIKLCVCVLTSMPTLRVVIPLRLGMVTE